MIQSIASSATQMSSSLESLSRLGTQASRTSGSVSVIGTTAGAEKSASGQVAQLTPEQQQEVEKLKQTDRKVRQHEQAHLVVGGNLVISGPTYTYQTGPDKQHYAVGGEVSIDTSPAHTPAETIPKAEHIRATALAPADPSAQDQSVAANAGRMESEARIELAAQQREQSSTSGQGSTRLYRDASQVDQVGVRLDFFA